MKNWLQSFDRNIIFCLKEIGQKADQKNFTAFVVGGFVRDVILKRKNFDLDMVVEGNAVSLAEEFSREHGASLVVYKQFMTATVILPEGLRVDFTTARKEVYPYSAALPAVTPGSIHDDLFRRDFTINAMAISINSRTFGQLRDDFGGAQDLKNKKIRVLHPKSFGDDPTRILRAVRFEQRFHFRIEKNSLGMLKLALKNDAVRLVKPPRYFEEFKKILGEEHPQKSLKRLWKLGALNFLGIKLANFQQTFKLMQKIERQLGWWGVIARRSAFQRNDTQDWSDKALQHWLVYFMALAEGLSVGRWRQLFKKFHFKKGDQIKVLSCGKIPAFLKSLAPPMIKPSEVFTQLNPLSYETILFLKAKVRDRSTIKHIEKFLLKYDSIKLNISGRDLTRLGIPPGKQMGDILNKLLLAKIDGEIKTKEEELKKAQGFFST